METWECIHLHQYTHHPTTITHNTHTLHKHTCAHTNHGKLIILPLSLWKKSRLNIFVPNYTPNKFFYKNVNNVTFQPATQHSLSFAGRPSKEWLCMSTQFTKSLYKSHTLVLIIKKHFKKMQIWYITIYIP